MTTTEIQTLLLQALKNLQEHGPSEESHGICVNALNQLPFTERSFANFLLTRLFEDLGLDKTYPVPSGSRVSSLRAYQHHKNLWANNAYGDNRRALLDILVAELETR